MRVFLIFFIAVNYLGFSQDLEEKYFNINKEEISKRKFRKSKDYAVNVPVFYQNDSMRVGMLVKRKNYGILEREEFEQLKQYLSKLTKRKFEEQKTILINYLSSTPKTPYFGKKSHWTILRKENIEKITRLDNVEHIWINNPKNQNLEYFHKDRINWVEDSSRVVERLFFPYEFEFGNFVVINPQGKYISYFAEYGPEKVIAFIKESENL
ncbi:hypothetical protein [Haloflavibacter putidus]|uniref:Uncharacterized protein n=1 Tax=Haloflavibacter putidus TaxID=2576776 RepID=A0A507ZMW4_9FLAO|nr:hypothetical protein [Haloflavibacter putidus]TQD38890.1 hypothetical protein FKR84_07875 [Haloflavibacter putidus]